IVFARTGATTGKSFLIKSAPNAVFASYLIRLRPSKVILSEFLAYFFQSRLYWQQITENISGSAQPNCNATKLASIRVPVPPLNEQVRIVSKLELLFSKIALVEKRLDRIQEVVGTLQATAKLDGLIQSILAKAFRGQLVPQDSNDEP